MQDQFLQKHHMLTTDMVYQKIRDLSKLNYHPRPPIMLQTLSEQLLCSIEELVAPLEELRVRRFIQFDETLLLYVKLTLLGTSVTKFK